MRVWNGIEAYPSPALAAVASIGNYDGVHRGHRAILERVVGDARRSSAPSLLITFDPHPVRIVAPETALGLLQTRGQKLAALEQARLDGVLIVRFDAELAALDGETFFTRVLGRRVPLAALWVGESFRFGHRRSGDLALLRAIGEREGFRVHAVPAVSAGDETVSSSAIRAAVSAGDVERAARMLGRPYALAGEVVRGEGRGRSLDTPTANLRVDNDILPAHGVYVTETVALAARHPSVTNVGRRPTFAGRETTVETHLLGFHETLYEERIEVRFLARLRDEMRFASPSELADQLARDRAAAESYFTHREPGPR